MPHALVLRASDRTTRLRKIEQVSHGTPVGRKVVTKFSLVFAHRTNKIKHEQITALWSATAYTPQRQGFGGAWSAVQFGVTSLRSPYVNSNSELFRGVFVITRQSGKKHHLLCVLSCPGIGRMSVSPRSKIEVQVLTARLPSHADSKKLHRFFFFSADDECEKDETAAQQLFRLQEQVLSPSSA